MKMVVISLIVISFAGFFVAIGEAVRDEDLVLYLPFDAGTGNIAKDLSEHNNDGTLHKAKWAAGIYGSAVALSGEQGGGVEVPHAPSLDITDEITLMAWVYPQQFTDEWTRIVVKTWAGDTAPWMVYGLYLQGGTNGKPHFNISVNGQEKSTRTGTVPQLLLNQWTHLAATYDGSLIKLYYNGELKVEAAATGQIDANDVPVSIGRNSEGNREHYVGRIDEVAIWNTALDASEIKQAMDGEIVEYPGGTITTSNAQDAAHYIYGAAWGSGKIRRTTLDGSNIEDLVTGLRWPRDVALDIAGNKMYWVDAGANKVQRANLDGTNVDNLVNAQGHPFGVALDTTSGKMYWSIWNPGKIRRANLDGTNVEDLITGLKEPEDIDLDLSGGKIYWTDTATNKIQRANLDGSNIEDLVTVGLSHPLGLTLDVAGGKIYWTNTSFWPWGGPGVDKISRANLDGTNLEDLVTTGFSIAHGIALDVSAGKMYWADGGKISRANLDGSNVEDVIIGFGATGIAIGIPQPNTARPPDVPDESEPSVETPSFEPGKLYWTTDDKIRRADLDGSNIQEIVTGKKNLRGLAVDSADEKIYWTVAWTLNTDVVPKIQTADLDGSDIQDLVERVGSAQGIAVDGAGNKIYWTRPEIIQTADLDGMNTQGLITRGLHTPQSIALDITGNKIYWTDPRLHKIQRANLDGSNIQDLVERVESPYGIALDVAEDKMYWTARGTGKIQCANLDGSNIQDVVTGVKKPGSIAIDFAGRKIYWTEYEFINIRDRDVGEIRRTNLDGSNVEDIVAGLGAIYSIALSIPQATPPELVVTTTDEPDDVYSPSDVNEDGQTDADDVCLVAAALWQTSPENPRTDVNADGIVNAQDIVFVAENLDDPQVPGAPSNVSRSQNITPETVQQVLNLLRVADNGSLVFRHGIANLKRLLASIIPKKTGLLANYPNPFNPETWIPYQLSEPAEVTLHIYAIDGRLIRTLALGHQPAGMYQSKNRAAFWDGRNELGESVASGVYFYTLTADDFTATRKMLILK